MTDFTASKAAIAERTREAPGRRRTGSRTRLWRAALAGAALLAVAAVVGGYAWRGADAPAMAAQAAPPVTVGQPLQQNVQASGHFLGQFSAIDSVELRAQVGGILTEISFQDGQIVHQGDPLFAIDPRPFQIKLDQAVAQLQTAQARQALTQTELWRAQQLKRNDFGSVETVDQRAADERGAQAAIDSAKAAIMDARLDLEFARIAVPFTGRIGAHLVSIGSLVSGSRGGSTPTTLLATIVSLDPIHLDFDMSESDYATYQQSHRGAPPHDAVAISLDGGAHFDIHGTLDFIDNAVNRSSGTIRARATVPNPDLAITPGQFARLRLALGPPAPALLVPAAAVVPDQSRQVVMTVAEDGTVVPKSVEIGDLDRGLRVIRGGLAASDRVIINGLVRARPGAKVAPVPGEIRPDSATDAF